MRPEEDVIGTAVTSVLSSLSKTSLKSLSPTQFRATEENVALIVAATSNLIRIDVELSEPVQNDTIFKNIVGSNPHLREVSIIENYAADGERDRDSALEYLRVLVRSPQMS